MIPVPGEADLQDVVARQRSLLSKFQVDDKPCLKKQGKGLER